MGPEVGRVSFHRAVEGDPALHRLSMKRRALQTWPLVMTTCNSATANCRQEALLLARSNKHFLFYNFYSCLSNIWHFDSSNYKLRIKWKTWVNFRVYINLVQVSNQGWSTCFLWSLWPYFTIYNKRFRDLHMALSSSRFSTGETNSVEKWIRCFTNRPLITLTGHLGIWKPNE